MSEPVVPDEQERAPSPSQSGMRIWLACALFVLVPALLILVVKYLLGL